MVELMAVATLVMVLNVLDSVTTQLCFKQYPDKELKGESNPMMRWLMLKDRRLAEVIKQSVVLGWVIVLFQHRDIYALRFVGIMLGLVVANNIYILVTRAVKRRKVASPLRMLQKVCHIPDSIVYILVIIIIIGLAYLINGVIWGFQY